MTNLTTYNPIHGIKLKLSKQIFQSKVVNFGLAYDSNWLRITTPTRQPRIDHFLTPLRSIHLSDQNLQNFPENRSYRSA